MKPTLLFEFHATSAAGAAEHATAVQEIAAEHGGSEFRWATTTEDRATLWAARHNTYYAALAMRPGGKAWVTDVCVPISALAECIVETKRELAASRAYAPLVGHVGDGNFHLNFVLDPGDPRAGGGGEGAQRAPGGRARCGSAAPAPASTASASASSSTCSTSTARTRWRDAGAEAGAGPGRADEPGKIFLERLTRRLSPEPRGARVQRLYCRPSEALMRVHVASAVVAGALLGAPRLRASQLRAALRLQQAGEHLRHVTEFEARNPHSYVHIKAVDENGKTQEYVCESHGVTQLTRNGITPQILKVGSRIRVTGLAVAAQPVHVLLRQRRTRRRARAERQRSARRRARPRRRPLPKRTDIFGTWLLAPIANRSTSGPQPMISMLTPAGEKAVAAYDPFKDDPTFRCDPVAIRRVWGAPGTPLQIVRDGQRHRAAPRVDGRAPRDPHEPEDPSEGRQARLARPLHRTMEGDTLVIETANYSAGVLNQYVEQPGSADPGAAALGRAHLGGAAAPRRRRASGWWSRWICWIPSSSSSRSRAPPTSTRRRT